MASFEPLISSTVSGCLTVALQGLEQGAVLSGMAPDDARDLVRQALLGSVSLMEDAGQSPAVLKDRVASPGGTTIAGLASLEMDAVRGTLMLAVSEAVKNAGEGRLK